MRLVDGSQARVRVVVGVHAETERLVVPNRLGSPVIFVVAEAIHLLGQTLLLHLGFLMTFALLLALAFFLQLFAGVFRDFFLKRWRAGNKIK